MADFSLTILGAGTACPDPGGACSGYLLRAGDSQVQVDVGSGVVGHLRQHTRMQELDAIAISHLHADHYFDLIPLYYGLKYGHRRPERLGPRTPLYLPPGGREHMRRLCHIVTGDAEMLEDAFDLREYEVGPPQQIGGFTFSFHLVQHYIPSHAMRIMPSGGGPLLVFSSDVAPCRPIVEAARGADVFLCESVWLSAEEDDPDPLMRGHLTAGEAGAIAQEAGAKRLLLTHCRRGPHVDQHHMDAATAAFNGPVSFADEGQTYSIEGSVTAE